jgi:hypothetical protein
MAKLNPAAKTAPKPKAPTAFGADGKQRTVTIPPKKPKAPAKAAKPAPKKAAKAAPAPTGKRAAIEAAARAGKLPEPPDFSAATHKPYRVKLEALVAMVKAKDIKALKSFEIKPYSSSPKAIARYRDLAILALDAKAGWFPVSSSAELRTSKRSTCRRPASQVLALTRRPWTARGDRLPAVTGKADIREGLPCADFVAKMRSDV